MLSVSRLFLFCMLFNMNFALADVQLVQAKDSGKRLSDFAHILISGKINSDDPEKLRASISQLEIILKDSNSPPNMSVLLDSPGGNVSSAIEMGNILRESLAHTVVDGGASCSSACILLLAGGVMRDVFFDGKLGLHRPRFEYEEYANLSSKDAKQAYDKLVDKCVEYMKNMGVSDNIFSDMLKTPSQDIKFVSRDYAEENNLIGVDPGWEEWSRAKQIKNEGNSNVNAFDELLTCYNSGEKLEVCNIDYQKKIK